MGANREYKSSVFSLLFSEPDTLRELYSALEGRPLPADIPITIDTLEGALFMNRLNDVSFEIGDRLVVLIEHQSSINPNMPLRLLLYIARLYEKLTANRKTFGGKQITLPRPKFIVLYNGAAPYPDEGLLRLSDAFADPSSLGLGKDTPPDLELVVKVYNINKGRNGGKFRHSRTLEGYREFIGRVRELAEGLTKGRTSAKLTDEELTWVITEAVKWCIDQNILKEFFERNGSEVINMLFAEFDMEAELAAEREAGWEAGQEIGQKIGLEMGQEIGQKAGLEIGRKEQNLAIAKNALAEGASPEFVRKITGLDLETIARLSST